MSEGTPDSAEQKKVGADVLEPLERAFRLGNELKIVMERRREHPHGYGRHFEVQPRTNVPSSRRSSPGHRRPHCPAGRGESGRAREDEAPGWQAILPKKFEDARERAT